MSAPAEDIAVEVRGLDIVLNAPNGDRTVIVDDISFAIPKDSCNTFNNPS